MRTPTDYRTIKVPEWLYEDIRKVVDKLRHNGLMWVPVEVLEPKCCPLCRAKPNRDETVYCLVVCPKCGYSWLPLVSAPKTTAGSVLGMGLNALLMQIEKEDRRGKQA